MAYADDLYGCSGLTMADYSLGYYGQYDSPYSSESLRQQNAYIEDQLYRLTREQHTQLHNEEKPDNIEEAFKEEPIIDTKHRRVPYFVRFFFWGMMVTLFRKFVYNIEYILHFIFNL